jgi:hypothetical protein
MHMLLLLCVSVNITHLLAVVVVLLLLHLQPLLQQAQVSVFVRLY